MAIHAILFDVGGPIDTEVEFERLVDQHILEALHAAGIDATTADLEAASRQAVAAFAPDAYAAMIWTLAGRDAEIAREVTASFEAREADRAQLRGGLELRSGMSELVASLRARGIRLGLAANQPVRVIEELDRLGIGDYFTDREVSGHHGLRKPDVRLLLRACERLGVEPSECVMVGDRLDCDIVPARQLGMRTIRFRTGRHIDQQPRSADDMPHAEVTSVAELAAALDAVLA